MTRSIQVILDPRFYGTFWWLDILYLSKGSSLSLSDLLVPAGLCVWDSGLGVCHATRACLIPIAMVAPHLGPVIGSLKSRPLLS